MPQSKATRTLQTMYETAKAAVRVRQELGEWFELKEGTKQGCTVSIMTFITYLKWVMDEGET